MSRSLRRLLLAPAAAVSLVFAATGTAFAAPDTTVSVFNADGTAAGSTVCEFYFEFSPVPGGEGGSWELRDAESSVVADGTYEVTANDGDRHPASGTFSFANGTYVLAWDDESPMDRSREEHEIVVECAAPTETPFQSVAAETDVPTGGEAGETPLPTLPPTTTSGGPDAGGWSGLVAALALGGGLVLLMTPHRQRRRR